MSDWLWPIGVLALLGAYDIVVWIADMIHNVQRSRANRRPE